MPWLPPSPPLPEKASMSSEGTGKGCRLALDLLPMVDDQVGGWVDGGVIGQERGPACWSWSQRQWVAAHGRRPGAGTRLLDLGPVAVGGGAWSAAKSGDLPAGPGPGGGRVDGGGAGGAPALVVDVDDLVEGHQL